MTDQVMIEKEEFVLNSDKREGIRRLNRRTIFLTLPTLAFFFLSCGYLKAHLRPPLPIFLRMELDFLPWIMTLFYACLYVAILAVMQRKTSAVITLSMEGITLNLIGDKMGTVRWEEIADVRAFDLFARMIAIDLRDLDAVCRRWGRHGWGIRLSSWCIPIYRCFGIRIAPISIPALSLPISAEEFVERVRSYRSRMLAGPPIDDGETWPPSPSGQAFRD